MRMLWMCHPLGLEEHKRKFYDDVGLGSTIEAADFGVYFNALLRGWRLYCVL